MKPYKRSSDGLWIGVIDLGRDGAGRRRRKTVSAKRRSDVIVKLRDLRRDLEAGLAMGASERTTVESWMRHWIENIAAERLRPRTFITYRSLVNQQIIPTIGQYKLLRLTPAQVREMNTLNDSRGFSRSTVLGAHTVLRAALKDAHRDGLVPRNVVDMVDAPRLKKVPKVALTAEQARHLIRTSAEAGDPLTTRYAAALMLGLRQGELLGLERDRVLFGQNKVDLSWALGPLPQIHGCGHASPKGVYPCGISWAASCPEVTYRVPVDYGYRKLKGGLALVPPKTRSSVRQVPLIPSLANALRHHIDSQPPNPYGLMWVNTHGHPIHPSADTKWWYRALERADLPKVLPHAARHTTATLLLDAGVPIQVISQILGHSGSRTTEIYTHVDQEMATRALGHLSDLLVIDP